MSAGVADAAVAGTEGLPRRNGELVFEAPWEARAFGVAVTLCRALGWDWDEFRLRLIDEIGEWERAHPAETGGWSYYERWLEALERLVLERELLTARELDERTTELAHLAAHDHDHEHGDHHHHHHA